MNNIKKIELEMNFGREIVEIKIQCHKDISNQICGKK